MVVPFSQLRLLVHGRSGLLLVGGWYWNHLWELGVPRDFVPVVLLLRGRLVWVEEGGRSLVDTGVGLKRLAEIVILVLLVLHRVLGWWLVHGLILWLSINGDIVCRGSV